MIGDGALRPTVEQQVEDLGIKGSVIFKGNIDNVADYLNAIDLIVMPSLFEGLPLTLIEQQANGLSCVVSDTITKEADKTGQLTFLPLKDGPIKWGELIRNFPFVIDRKEKSRQSIKLINDAGYSIKKESLNLLKLYATL